MRVKESKKLVKNNKPVKARNSIVAVEIKEQISLNTQIEALTSVIKNNKGIDIESIIKANNKVYDSKILQLTKYIGEKIETINKTLIKKPTSFIFDIKRDDDGYIDKVLVKPNK